jgi:hypothetical protein
MKRSYYFGLALCLALATSCDDGDLQIETLDFDSVSIESCENTITTSTEVLFKINGDETLILELGAGLLMNEVTTEARTSTFPSNSNLIYRIFDGSVTSAYFCDVIPPVSPVVVEEIVASSGTVSVTTTSTDGVTFTHLIQLEGITLLNGQNERITDLSINDFGEITTSTSSK